MGRGMGPAGSLVANTLDHIRRRFSSSCSGVSHGLGHCLLANAWIGLKKAASHSKQVRKRLCVATAAISSSRGSTAVAKVASAGAFFPNSDGSNVTASQDKAPSKGTSSTVDETLALDLDFKAQLTWQQEVLSLAIPALVCGLIYATTAPGAFSWLYAASMAAAYASMVYGIRSRLEEDLFKARERLHAELGDADSLFRSLSDSSSQHLSVHVKVKAAPHLLKQTPPQASRTLTDATLAQAVTWQQVDPASSAAAINTDSPTATAAAAEAASLACSHAAGTITAAHCYHGFGANVGSYVLVQEQLAQRLGGVVTAHDMPGFGLTERPTSLGGYFLDYNGRLGRLVMDYELAHLQLLPPASQHAHTPGMRADVDAATASMHLEARAGAGMDVNMTLSSSQGAAFKAEQHKNKGPIGAAAGAVTDVLAEAALGSDADSSCGSSAALDTAASVASLEASSDNSTTTTSRSSSESITSSARTVVSRSPAAMVTRILIGHSMGGACAALEACRDPDAIAGLVLVAPAIIALPGPEYASVQLKPTPPVDAYAAPQPQQQQSPEGARDVATAAADTTSTSRPSDSPSSTPSLSPASSAGSAEVLQAAADTFAHAHATEAASTSAPAPVPYLGKESQQHRPTDPPYLKRLYPSGFQAHTPPSASGAAFSISNVAQTAKPDSSSPDFSALLKAVLTLVKALAMLGTLLTLRALSPLITLVLRVLVRSKAFWERGLQQAYYNPSQVTAKLVDAYRSPQLVKGWEAGMVAFLLARLSHTRSLKDLFSDTLYKLHALLPDPNKSPAQASSSPAAAAAASAPAAAARKSTSEDDADLAVRLASLVQRRRMPVLIVHGVADRLVPLSNSVRLARMLPGAELVVLERCGHMPQEELPEDFVELVAEFAERLQPTKAWRLWR